MGTSARDCSGRLSSWRSYRAEHTFFWLRKKYSDLNTLHYRLRCSKHRKTESQSTVGKLAHPRAWSRMTSREQGEHSSSRTEEGIGLLSFLLPCDQPNRACNRAEEVLNVLT